MAHCLIRDNRPGFYQASPRRFPAVFGLPGLCSSPEHSLRRPADFGPRTRRGLLRASLSRLSVSSPPRGTPSGPPFGVGYGSGTGALRAQRHPEFPWVLPRQVRCRDLSRIRWNEQSDHCDARLFPGDLSLGIGCRRNPTGFLHRPSSDGHIRDTPKARPSGQHSACRVRRSRPQPVSLRGASDGKLRLRASDNGSGLLVRARAASAVRWGAVPSVSNPMAGGYQEPVRSPECAPKDGLECCLRSPPRAALRLYAGE